MKVEVRFVGLPFRFQQRRSFLWKRHANLVNPGRGFDALIQMRIDFGEVNTIGGAFD